MRKAQRRSLTAWRQKMRRTTATTRAARLAATRNPPAAHGKHPVPQAVRNFVWCGECRVLMAYSWRKAILNNNKTLLQRKATEKWYRAVTFKNLTEGSEGIPLAANGRGNTRVWRILEVTTRRCAEKQNAPDFIRSVLAKFKLRRKTAFAMVSKQAAERSPAPVLA